MYHCIFTDLLYTYLHDFMLSFFNYMYTAVYIYIYCLNFKSSLNLLGLYL